MDYSLASTIIFGRAHYWLVLKPVGGTMQIFEVLVCLIPLLIIIGLPLLIDRVIRPSRKNHRLTDEDLLIQQQITRGKAADDATDTLGQ